MLLELLAQEKYEKETLYQYSAFSFVFFTKCFFQSAFPFSNLTLCFSPPIQTAHVFVKIPKDPNCCCRFLRMTWKPHFHSLLNCSGMGLGGMEREKSSAVDWSSLNDYNSQIWYRPMPVVRRSISVSHMDSRNTNTFTILHCFPVTRSRIIESATGIPI